MTDQELKDIVAAVVAELEKSGVDFDYKAEPAEDGDLVFVIRGTAPNYQGVTVTWKGLLDIITAQATQAKNDAETAKNAANTILEQVQSKGTEITNFVATSKAELETQKNESVNAVKSVYQTDLNELKGDLGDLTENGKNLLNTSSSVMVDGAVFRSNGEIATGLPAYAVSDWITISAEEKYSINRAYQIAWFKSDKTFIGFASDRISGSSVVTSPLESSYLRISISKEDLPYAMIVKGDEEISLIPENYEPYKIVLKKDKLPKIEEEDLPSKFITKYRYLMFTFLGSLNYASNMVILGSDDGKKFDLVGKMGTYIAKNTHINTSKDISETNGVRDPAIIKIGCWYYIVYTVIGWSNGYEIGMCKTKDFVNYTELDNIALTNEDGNYFSRVWAPCWYQDGHDYYISVGCEYNSQFRMYLMKYDIFNHTIIEKHNTGIGANDYHFYYENGYYYALANDCAERSTNLFSSYSVVRTPVEAGKIEGDYAIRLDNGKWRVYVALINGYSTTDGVGYYDIDNLGVTSRPVITPIELTDSARAYQTETGYLYTHPFVIDNYDDAIIRGDIDKLLKSLT